MIRRDFANFLIYHPVAIALEEYMHDAYIPDELMYATFSRINHIAEKYLPEENCIPWHGRLVRSSHFSKLSNICSWEDCGTKCQENKECSSWSWNSQEKSGSTSGCKDCLLYPQSATISNTTLTKDWISGKKSCYSSIRNYVYLLA